MSAWSRSLRTGKVPFFHFCLDTFPRQKQMFCSRLKTGRDAALCKVPHHTPPVTHELEARWSAFLVHPGGYSIITILFLPLIYLSGMPELVSSNHLTVIVVIALTVAMVPNVGCLEADSPAGTLTGNISIGPLGLPLQSDEIPVFLVRMPGDSLGGMG